MISAHTVEEVLHRIEDTARFLQAFGESAAVNHEAPLDAHALSGLADAAGQIASWSRAIFDALDVDALGTEIGSKQHRKRGTGGRQS